VEASETRGVRGRRRRAAPEGELAYLSRLLCHRWRKNGRRDAIRNRIEKDDSASEGNETNARFSRGSGGERSRAARARRARAPGEARVLLRGPRGSGLEGHAGVHLVAGDVFVLVHARERARERPRGVQRPARSGRGGVANVGEWSRRTNRRRAIRSANSGWTMRVVRNVPARGFFARGRAYHASSSSKPAKCMSLRSKSMRLGTWCASWGRRGRAGRQRRVAGGGAAR
jgi:hypothetical protein